MVEKGKTAVSCQVESDIWAEFLRFTKFYGFSKNGAIEKALKDFAEKLKKQNNL